MAASVQIWGVAIFRPERAASYGKLQSILMHERCITDALAAYVDACAVHHSCMNDALYCIAQFETGKCNTFASGSNSNYS